MSSGAHTAVARCVLGRGDLIRRNPGRPASGETGARVAQGYRCLCGRPADQAAPHGRPRTRPERSGPGPADRVRHGCRWPPSRPSAPGSGFAARLSSGIGTAAWSPNGVDIGRRLVSAGSVRSIGARSSVRMRGSCQVKKCEVLHTDRDSSVLQASQEVIEAIYQAYVPGQNNYGAEIDELQAAGINVAFIGGYHTEVALMARAARDRGYPLQLVGGTLGTEEFGLIAGAAADGALFVDPPDPTPRRSGACRRAVPSVGLRAGVFHPVRLRRRSGVGAGGRESRLAGAPGDDRGPARAPVRHRARPDRLRRQGRSHCAKPGVVCLASIALVAFRQSMETIRLTW